MASEYMRGTVIDVVILLSPFAIFRTPAARGTSLMRSDGLRGKLQRVASVKRLSSTTFLDPKGSVHRPGRCGVCWLVDCVNDPVPDRHAGGITSDLERIEAGANHIDIHFRPTRLGPLLDVATPLPSASDDETQILPVPIRLQRAGREIAMRIDGTDPFATAKPDARLIKLLIRARLQRCTRGQRQRALCRTGQPGRREPVLFHAARPPQLSRPGHHRSHPRRTPAARSDRRQAAGAFTSAAWLARAADRARLCLSCCALKLTDIVTPRGNRTSLAGQYWHCCEPHREHSGTGIWPDRDIPTSRRHVTRHARLCRPRRLPHPARPREKPGFSTWEGEIPRDADSPLEGTGFESSVPLWRRGRSASRTGMVQTTN